MTPEPLPCKAFASLVRPLREFSLCSGLSRAICLFVHLPPASARPSALDVGFSTIASEHSLLGHVPDPHLILHMTLRTIHLRMLLYMRYSNPICSQRLWKGICYAQDMSCWKERSVVTIPATDCSVAFMALIDQFVLLAVCST